MMYKEKLLERLKKEVLKTASVIRAFNQVKREDYVLEKYKEYAYVDEPLPISAGQTISQPYTVALMTEALKVRAGQKILEIGAGSGYQAAILAEIVGPGGKVYTIELVDRLVYFAKENLKNYKNVKVILGDGSKGLPKQAPFDRIIVTAAARQIPEKLFEQLKEKGRMVIPVGKTGFAQRMLVVKKVKGKRQISDLGSFVFVPLIES